MKHFVTYAPIAALCLALAGCSDDSNERSEDLTTQVNHQGSVETILHVEDLDSSRRVLVTSHKVWVRDTLFRNIVYRDTIPALGTVQTVAENSEGDSRSVSVNRDYEFYITTK